MEFLQKKTYQEHSKYIIKKEIPSETLEQLIDNTATAKRISKNLKDKYESNQTKAGFHKHFDEVYLNDFWNKKSNTDDSVKSWEELQRLTLTSNSDANDFNKFKKGYEAKLKATPEFFEFLNYQ